MKKLMVVVILIVGLMVLNLYTEHLKCFKVLRYPFQVYKDGTSRINNCIPSGWAGDFRDLKIDHKWTINPKKGTSCMKIEYSAETVGAKWASLNFAQNPYNHWTSIRGGYDLSTAKKIYFYARGNKGDEVVEFRMAPLKGQQAKISKRIELSKEWKKYELELNNKFEDMAGGFSVLVKASDNSGTVTFYIDEIYYTNQDEMIDTVGRVSATKNKIN
ncbi:MAG: hypothetical protein JW827_03300 [Spirochaetes bacterium]|nr:hypothetical protein [Spirochaetota bacterium]